MLRFVYRHHLFGHIASNRAASHDVQFQQQRFLLDCRFFFLTSLQLLEELRVSTASSSPYRKAEYIFYNAMECEQRDLFSSCLAVSVQYLLKMRGCRLIAELSEESCSEMTADFDTHLIRSIFLFSGDLILKHREIQIFQL